MSKLLAASLIMLEFPT